MKHFTKTRLFVSLALPMVLLSAPGCAARAPIVKDRPGVVRVQAAKPQEPLPDVRPFGQEDLKSAASVRTAPNGDLIVLDSPAKDTFQILRFSRDGARLAAIPVPAQIRSPNAAVVDSSGVYYLAGLRDKEIWALRADGTASAVPVRFQIKGLDLKNIAGTDYLFALGASQADGVVRFRLPQMTPETIPLGVYPAGKRGFEYLRVRSNGDLYAYSGAEALVWHYDPTGRLIDKFGSGGDAHTSLPASFISRSFDVDDTGDLYWSLGGGDPLLRYTADGTMGIAYRGKPAWNRLWTAPISGIRGLALSGDRAIVLEKSDLVSFPKNLAAPNAKDTVAVSTNVFGLSMHLESDQPYKMFTDSHAPLRVVIAAGNRRLGAAAFTYRLYTMEHEIIAQGRKDLTFPGGDALTFELPLELPKLGWYELDLALLNGSDVISEKLGFLARVEEDPRLPIPAKESSGWDDMPTHKAVGLGLHRFALAKMSQLDDPKFLDNIAQAKQMGIPYFVQISRKVDCTPENVQAVLQKLPDLPLLEITNEPDTQGFTPEKYVDLLRPCYEAAKRTDPAVKILGPAKSGLKLDWLERFFKAGGGQYVDAISIHSYERNNSMDPYHWLWHFAALKKMMATYGCGEKPLYQTKHGYAGFFYIRILRHLWQARAAAEEYLVMDRFGTSPDRFFYYYLNPGGYINFPTYLVNGDRELYPAAVMMRTQAHLLGDRRYAAALDFGDPGNWLLLGNRYDGPESDALVLMNCGAWRPVPVHLTLPESAKAFDCFGNPVPLAISSGAAQLAVGRYPTYLFVPHGAKVSMTTHDFGHNIAPEAKVEVNDPDALKKADLLTNGLLDFDFTDEPEHYPFAAAKGKLPLDLTMQFAAPKMISSAIVYGSLADNDHATPLAYDVSVHTNGVWKKVDTVDVPVEARVVQLDPLTPRVSWYDDPWIFVHNFTPVRADAMRFHFLRTTFGQNPNAEVNYNNKDQQVELREVQIFTP